MSERGLSGQAGEGGSEQERPGHGNLGGSSDGGALGQALAALSRLYPVPRVAVAALLWAGVSLGAAGDALLRASGPPGLNLSLWIAAVAAAAVALQRRAARALDRQRAVWLGIGVLFAAGLAWRDAPPLKLLALGCATLTFALAAHGTAAAWVRRAGVVRYAGALALGALHAWTAAALALADATWPRSRINASGGTGRRRVAGFVRGLLIAVPLVAVFAALLMAADAVFAQLMTNLFRFDFEHIASHIVVFLILAWLSTGYLRGFLTGTELPPLPFAPKRPTLGIAEVATVLAALDVLFLLFVVVQFRYLFGGDTLVQITPGLTYAEYARRGFFELVFVVVLMVPILLGADWLLDRRSRRDTFVFRSLAGLQTGLVLAIAASALQRLRLYHASYGLTESRFYAMTLLLWMGALLLWLGATVLRGRRDSFAFGALVSGLATIAMLFVLNPDALVARTNVARMAADAPARFDVAYATSLSGDAVPVLIHALSTLPPDVQCPLARQMLRRWPPERERSIRNWNWSAWKASDAVRGQEAQLRSMLGPEQKCAAPSVR